MGVGGEVLLGFLETRVVIIVVWWVCVGGGGGGGGRVVVMVGGVVAMAMFIVVSIVMITIDFFNEFSLARFDFIFRSRVLW